MDSIETAHINWNTNSPGKNYARGSRLSVTMDDTGHCVEIHRGPDKSDEIYSYFGSLDTTGQAVTWFVNDDCCFKGSDVSITNNRGGGNWIAAVRGPDNGKDKEAIYYSVGNINEQRKMHYSKKLQVEDVASGSGLSIAMSTFSMGDTSMGNCL